jgi:hypothetical protein
LPTNHNLLVIICHSVKDWQPQIAGKPEMRLYHSRLFGVTKSILLSLIAFSLYSCNSPQVTQAQIQVSLTADGKTTMLQLPSGSTVQQAIDQASLSLNTLDRTDPPEFTILRQGATIRLIRITEEFEIKQMVIPYEQQTLRNESLAVDKEVLIQKGKTGLQEITYRQVYEDGIEVTSGPVIVKSAIVEEPIPEIRMIGVQAPFSPIAIPGKLVYLRDGNAWMIEGNTGNRHALLTTGDLDGRIFSLSSDGTWLLFTRRSGVEGRINNLWVANLGMDTTQQEVVALQEEQKMVDLNVANVVHFADWLPGSSTKILFSTVEPRAAPPGWQANNDLILLTFSASGWTTKWTTILEPNAGGVYGWWGTDFLWSLDGQHLAFTRPDSIGIVDYDQGILTTTLKIVPLQTHSDWAWVPGITWGPDGNALYTIEHVAQSGAISPEESQAFDLTAVLTGGGPSLRLVSQIGMFAYPLASPLQTQSTGEIDYQIAFLQAVFPEQSETSRYRLVVMDRDGSNRRSLFPTEESIGLEPQLNWGAWSPAPMESNGNYAIAVLHQGNLWLVDTINGEAIQVTGDGLTTRLIWR